MTLSFLENSENARVAFSKHPFIRLHLNLDQFLICFKPVFHLILIGCLGYPAPSPRPSYPALGPRPPKYFKLAQPPPT